MSSAFKAGLIQTNVSNEMAENVAFVREQARLARDAGADFIMTPENTGLIGANRCQQRVAASFRPVRDADARHEEKRHGCPDGPSVPARAGHGAERVGQ